VGHRGQSGQSMAYNAVTRAAGERAEALRMENVDALAGLRRKAQVPIATGECLYTKYEFRQLLAKEAADIIQPDICLAGGVLEQKKIAAIAEAHYVMVAPHNLSQGCTAWDNRHSACRRFLDCRGDHIGDRPEQGLLRKRRRPGGQQHQTEILFRIEPGERARRPAVAERP
jgi:hypothetical protein